jgi:hypothetical protein
MLEKFCYSCFEWWLIKFGVNFEVVVMEEVHTSVQLWSSSFEGAAELPLLL